jgi:hypothetical protein
LLTYNQNPIYCRSETQLRLVFSSLHFKYYPPLLVSLPQNLYPIPPPPDSMRVLLYPPTHSLLSALAGVPLPLMPGEAILSYICSCSMVPSMCGLVLSMVVQFLWSLGRDGVGYEGCLVGLTHFSSDEVANPFRSFSSSPNSPIGPTHISHRRQRGQPWGSETRGLYTKRLGTGEELARLHTIWQFKHQQIVRAEQGNSNSEEQVLMMHLR